MPDERIPFLDDEPIPFSDVPAPLVVEPTAREVVAELVPAEDPSFATAGLPTIEGHPVSLPEWRAFDMYCRTEGKISDRVAAAAQEAGVTTETVNSWRQRPWWNGLFELFVEGEQQALHADLVLKREKASSFVEGLLGGSLSDKQMATANAGMAAVTLLTKIGKKPLQDTRSLMQINQGPVNNGGTMNVDQRKLKEVTDTDMLEYLTTGKALPE